MMRWMPKLRTILTTFLLLVAGLLVAVVLFLRLPWITTEAVSFSNGDVTLIGTLALPRWVDGPYPVAVVVQGSGSMPRWPYWAYARNLVPQGMAVLIYDKRGVGASSGTYPQSGGWSAERIASCGDMFELLGGDALAGVELLKSRDDIDASRIGFAGVSQAGWIMPLAASRTDDIAFIISISGPAVSCGMEDWYSQLTGEYNAYPELNGPTPYADGELSDDEIEHRIDDYEGPQGYDPVPILAALQVPTLWLLGGRDRSVPTSRSVANLEQLIAQGAPFELEIYPEGDHSLRHPDSYRKFDYWEDVRRWLVTKGMLPSP